MATIITKNKTTSGTPSSLSQGELAVNIADKKLFVGGSGGSSVVDLEFDPESAAFDGSLVKNKSSADDSILQVASTNSTDGTFIDLKQNNSGLVMVFCNTQKITDYIAKNLGKQGINSIAIHGGLTQSKRRKT